MSNSKDMLTTLVILEKKQRPRGKHDSIIHSSYDDSIIHCSYLFEVEIGESLILLFWMRING